MTRECFLLLVLASATACTGKDSGGGPPGSDNGNVIEGQNGTTGQNGGQAGNGSQNGNTAGNGGTAGSGNTTGSASTDGNGGTTGSGNTTGNAGTTGNGNGDPGTGNASGPGSDECQATSAPDYQLNRTNLNAQLIGGSTALVSVKLVTCTGVDGYKLVVEGAEPAISLQLPVIADDTANMTVLGADPNAPVAVPSATFTQRYGALPMDLAGYTHIGFDAYASLDMDPPYLRIAVIGYADGECDQCTAEGCSQCGNGWEGGQDLLKIQEASSAP